MNVTPLVDVVLVLLIIFMVVIPQMQAGATVNLQGVAHPDPSTSTTHPPITVSVTRSGHFFVEKAEIARDRLIAVLRDGHTRQPQSRLILKGDRDVPYHLVRSLFHDCQEVGFPGIALQVGDLRKGEGG